MKRYRTPIRRLRIANPMGILAAAFVISIWAVGCGGSGGDGENGGDACPDGQALVVEPITNTTECEAGGSLEPCASSCPEYCTGNGFPLGSRDESCVTDVFGSFCQCDCAYCR